MVLHLKNKLISPLSGGLIKDLEDYFIAENQSGDASNVIFRKGLLRKALGYSREWDTDFLFPIMNINQYYKQNGDFFILAQTTKDIWERHGSAWSMITPTYTTGTASIAVITPTQVTGGGTLWNTNAKVGDQIRFGADTTWYTVNGVSDDTHLVLSTPYAGTLPLVSVSYVLRQCLTATLDTPYGNTIMNDTYITTDINDYPRKWTGTGQIQLVGGSPPKAALCRVFENHLILGYLETGGTTYPLRLLGSDVGDFENFSTGESVTWDIDETPDKLTGFAILKDMFIVFKERSIWKVRYTGGTYVYSTELSNLGIGCMAPLSIAETMDQIYFLGPDDFYSFDGVSVSPIGDSKIKTVIAQANPQYRARAAALFIQEKNEIIWAYASGPSTTNNKFLIYNTIDKTWTIDDNKTSRAFGRYYSESDYTWDTLPFDSWDSITLETWDSTVLLENDAVNLMAGVTDNYIYRLEGGFTNNGTAFTGYWTTPPITFDAPDLKKRLFYVEPWVMNEGVGTLNVSVQADGGSFVPIGSVSLNGTTNIIRIKLPCDLTGNDFRIRLSGTDFFRALAINSYYTVKGRI